MPQSYSAPSDPGAADYTIVVSNADDIHGNFHDFAEKVNRKLRAGYQLHGPPFSVNQLLCQAMVRVEGPQNTGETTVFYKRAEDQRLR